VIGSGRYLVPNRACSPLVWVLGVCGVLLYRWSDGADGESRRVRLDVSGIEGEWWHASCPEDRVLECEKVAELNVTLLRRMVEKKELVVRCREQVMRWFGKRFKSMFDAFVWDKFPYWFWDGVRVADREKWSDVSWQDVLGLRLSLQDVGHFLAEDAEKVFGVRRERLVPLYRSLHVRLARLLYESLCRECCVISVRY